MQKWALQYSTISMKLFNYEIALIMKLLWVFYEITTSVDQIISGLNHENTCSE